MIRVKNFEKFSFLRFFRLYKPFLSYKFWSWKSLKLSNNYLTSNFHVIKYFRILNFLLDLVFTFPFCLKEVFVQKVKTFGPEVLQTVNFTLLSVWFFHQKLKESWTFPMRSASIPVEYLRRCQIYRTSMVWTSNLQPIIT